MQHAASRCVVFVDIEGRRPYCYDPHTDARCSWAAPDRIDSVLPNANDSWVYGMQGSLCWSDFASGIFSRTLPVKIDRSGNRLNDGYVDHTGVSWFDSMDDVEREASGQPYCVGRDGRLNVHGSDYAITNGPTVSLDNHALYHIDILQRVVYALDLGDDGSLEHRRVFANIDGSDCPDGMAADEEGCVWVTLFDGGRTERFSLDGRCIGRVDFSRSNIIELAFGGDNLQAVYAITARKGLTGEALLKEPLVGGLSAFHAPVKGLSPAECAVNFSAVVTGRS